MARVREPGGTKQPSSGVSGKLAENLDIVLQKFPFLVFSKERKKSFRMVEMIASGACRQ